MTQPIVTTTKQGVVEKTYSYGLEFYVSVKPSDGGGVETFRYPNPTNFKAGDKVSYTVTSGPKGNLAGETLTRSS